MRTPGNFAEMVYVFVDLLNVLYPVLTATALLVFIWGIVKFIAAGGDEKSITDGKNLMIWGIIALFVMVSVGAIIEFFSLEFGFTFGIPTLPQN